MLRKRRSSWSCVEAESSSFRLTNGGGAKSGGTGATGGEMMQLYSSIGLGEGNYGTREVEGRVMNAAVSRWTTGEESSTFAQRKFICCRGEITCQLSSARLASDEWAPFPTQLLEFYQNSTRHACDAMHL